VERRSFGKCGRHIFFALAIARLHFLEPTIQGSLVEVSQAHMPLGFWTMLLRAILAGWLIALMVWMLPDAASSRVIVIMIMTYQIGICSLSHIIAGSTNVFFLVAEGKLSIGQYFTSFFFPTLIGNVAGGVSLVAALAHAQVVGGKK
jgi:formate-nitrite transporter family protein